MLQTVSSRHRFSLSVVAHRDMPAIVVPPGRGGGPAYRGPGEVDYVCGGCGAVLCDGVSLGMFAALSFACRCGALNRLR